jgi:leucyl aminopeptidase
MSTNNQKTAQISVGASFAKNTASRLQSQLNAMAKRSLTLNIGKVKIVNKQFNQSMQKAMKQVETTSNKTTQTFTQNQRKKITAIDKLVSKYKMAQINYERFEKVAQRLIQSDKFKTRSLSQQTK